MKNSHNKRKKLLAAYKRSNEFSYASDCQLNFYDLVYVLKNFQDDEFIHCPHTDALIVFTDSKSPLKYFNIQNEAQLSSGKLSATETIPTNYHITPFMLGDLIYTERKHTTPTAIIVNPIQFGDEKLETATLFQDFCFAPIKDPLTSKMMMTDPEEALALFAMRDEDLFRIGVEAVFHIIGQKYLPMDESERKDALLEKIIDLKTTIPRVPIRRGCGTFYCVLLNLENEMEELAFIRDYKTFDQYSDVIFVTSRLKIFTGQLEEIEFDGQQIDTILLPLIEWQRKKCQE